MLVLTRKTDEQIMIGDQIKLTVLRVRGNTVRIGIEAPRDVRVLRGELDRFEQQSIELELGPGESTSDLEAVFAHPAPHRPVKTRKPASQSAASNCPNQAVTGADAVEDRQLYVGSVDRQGRRPDLQRAPLASWVTAN